LHCRRRARCAMGRLRNVMRDLASAL
jgi:hypothetical protein